MAGSAKKMMRTMMNMAVNTLLTICPIEIKRTIPTRNQMSAQTKMMMMMMAQKMLILNLIRKQIRKILRKNRLFDLLK